MDMVGRMTNKIIRHIFLALSICLAASCSSSISDDLAGTAVTVESPAFKVRIADDGTRTFIGEDLRLGWTSDDRISVFTDSRNQEYRFTGKTGDRNGVIESVSGSAQDSGVKLPTNYAVYPYSQSTSISSDGVISLTLPSVQDYAPGSFADGSNTMLGVTATRDDDSFLFSNVCGFLVVNLFGEGTVRTVTLSGNSGEILSGSATASVEPGKEPALTLSNSGATTLSIDCGTDGVRLGGTEKDATSFWFVVPPVVFSHGFTVTATDTRGYSFEVSTGVRREVRRNVLNEMAPMEVSSWKAQDCDKIMYRYQVKLSQDKYRVGHPFCGGTIIGHTYDPTSRWGTITIDRDYEYIEESAFSLAYIDAVRIPPSVISIEKSAFYYCRLKELQLPPNLRYIGEGAFMSNCLEDTTLIIPDQVERIEYGAFAGAASWQRSTRVKLGSGLKFIGDFAFKDEDFIGQLVIPQSVDSIGRYAFEESSFDGDVLIPAGVRYIGPFAFCKTYKMRLSVDPANPYYDSRHGGGIIYRTADDALVQGPAKYDDTLIIPNDVKIIGEGAFYYCSGSYCELVIPEGVRSIEPWAFAVCPFTGTLVIPDSVESIGESAFALCKGFQGSLIIGDGVKSIGVRAFDECRFQGDLMIGDGLTEIKRHMFSSCGQFQGSLTIGDGVEKIEELTFWDQGFSGDLTLGAGLREIGNSAFKNCKFTGSLIIPDKVTYVGESAFDGCSGFNESIHLGKSIQSIGSDAFKGCTGLTGDLVFPETLQEIGISAFQNDYQITGSLIIPDSVKSIGKYAFEKCRGINGSLIIGNGVKTVGEKAFSGCSFSGPVVIGDSVEELPADSIGYGEPCANNTLTLGKSLSYIGQGVFSGAGFTGELKLPEGLKYIGKGAFRYNRFTGSLRIPDSVTGLDDYAFDRNNFTDSLVIGNGIRTINTNTFSGCEYCTGPLVIGDGVGVIDEGAFKDFCFTGPLVLPERLYFIGPHAFDGCSSFMGNLRIPDGLLEIGDNAFSGCLGFTGSLSFGKKLETIGKEAFFYCRGLNGILTLSKETKVGRDAFSGCNFSETVYY